MTPGTKAPSRVRTAVTGFKVQCDHHYTKGASNPRRRPPQTGALGLTAVEVDANDYIFAVNIVRNGQSFELPRGFFLGPLFEISRFDTVYGRYTVAISAQQTVRYRGQNGTAGRS